MSRPFKEMKALEKKVLLIDLVSGGTWSRMVGNVLKADYTKVGSVDKDNPLETITVDIPDTMRNSVVEIYIVHYNPTTTRSWIGSVKKKVQSSFLSLDFKPREGCKNYFVIVNPINTTFLFNQIE